jgi:hypothetical protein
LKRSPLSKISKAKVQELIDKGERIPASSFAVAKKLGRGKKKGARSRKVWYKDVQHGSQTQLLVYQNYELIQLSGDISNLAAEVDYTLNSIGGGQVGSHRIDIQFFDEIKSIWQVFNVKGDYEGSIDALSIWKRRHFLKQYPTLPYPGSEQLFPVRYDFFIADNHGSRIFRNEKELLENI